MTKVLFVIGNIYGAHEVFNSQKEANNYCDILEASGEERPNIIQHYVEMTDDEGEMEILRYINPEAFEKKCKAKLEQLMRVNKDVLQRLKEA